MNILFAILLALCWICGFFVLAQIIWHQHGQAKRLDKLEKQTCSHRP